MTPEELRAIRERCERRNDSFDTRDEFARHARADVPALLDEVANLGKPLLVLQSPTDDTVEVENSLAIFEAAAQPKSYVSLEGADHLLQNRAGAAYAASMIAEIGRAHV